MKKFISVLLIIFVACSLACACSKNDTSKDAVKNITVKIIWEENEKELKFATTEKYLGAVLQKEDVIKGEKGQYGLFVNSVNGITANAEKEQWWCFTKGDEPIMTGVDMIEIKDGDLYKIILREGY